MKKKTIINILSTVFVFFMLFSTSVNASTPTPKPASTGVKGIIENGLYNRTSTTTLYDAGGNILGIVQTIALIVGAISLVIAAIRYFGMAASADSKASIKDSMIPFVIGAIISFAASGIIFIVGKFSMGI